MCRVQACARPSTRSRASRMGRSPLQLTGCRSLSQHPTTSGCLRRLPDEPSVHPLQHVVGPRLGRWRKTAMDEHTHLHPIPRRGSGALAGGRLCACKPGWRVPVPASTTSQLTKASTPRHASSETQPARRCVKGDDGVSTRPVPANPNPKGSHGSKKTSGLDKAHFQRHRELRDHTG